jgi:WD40 repeat protein
MTLKEHSSVVHGLCLIPESDGDFVSVSWDKKIKFWNVSKKNSLLTIDSGYRLYGVTINKKGETLIISGKKIILFFTKKGKLKWEKIKQIEEQEGEIYRVCFS